MLVSFAVSFQSTFIVALPLGKPNKVIEGLKGDARRVTLMGQRGVAVISFGDVLYRCRLDLHRFWCLPPCARSFPLCKYSIFPK